MKNKFLMMFMAFVAGAAVGALIFWMVCCGCCKKSCCGQQCDLGINKEEIHLINTKQANTYFKAYISTAIPDTLKAFTINLQQFNAMKLIEKAEPSVHGFRIYMGIDSGKPVRMVVGTGSPDKTDFIYFTPDNFSGPCPHVCDNTSPIMDK
jgi:hypothetical protein